MVVDAHAHLFHPRWYPRPFCEALVGQFARRRTAMGHGGGTLKAGESLFGMLSDDSGFRTIRVMDSVGIEKRVILIIDWGIELEEAPACIWEIHKEILGICAKFRDRLVGFAGIDPRREDATTILEWAFDELGARGLKLHPTGEWRLSDERTRRMVAMAAERQLPVMVHVGKTVDILSDRNSQPQAVIDLVTAYPQVKFIAGHSGFSLWRVFAEEVDTPGNLYFDISGWQKLAFRDLHGFEAALSGLLRAFPGRVCFGTDSPFYTYNIAMSERKWLNIVRGYLKDNSDNPNAPESGLLGNCFRFG